LVRFICRRGGDCLYRDDEGKCTRQPTIIYVDCHGYYANETCSSARYPIAININDCRYQGRELKDGEVFTTTRGRKRWI